MAIPNGAVSFLVQPMKSGARILSDRKALYKTGIILFPENVLLPERPAYFPKNAASN